MQVEEKGRGAKDVYPRRVGRSQRGPTCQRNHSGESRGGENRKPEFLFPEPLPAAPECNPEGAFRHRPRLTSLGVAPRVPAPRGWRGPAVPWGPAQGPARAVTLDVLPGAERGGAGRAPVGHPAQVRAGRSGAERAGRPEPRCAQVEGVRAAAPDRGSGRGRSPPRAPGVRPPPSARRVGWALLVSVVDASQGLTPRAARAQRRTRARHWGAPRTPQAALDPERGSSRGGDRGGGRWGLRAAGAGGEPQPSQSARPRPPAPPPLRD